MPIAPQHLVGGAEYAAEQLELLVEQLVNPHVGGIGFVEKIDDHDIEVLPVSMAPPDALFDALRIPRHIVIDDQRTELQIYSFGGSFGGYHNGRFVAEIIHDSRPLVGRSRAGDFRSTLVPLFPRLVNGGGVFVGVGAVEQHDLSFVAPFFEQIEEKILRAARFGKYQSFLRGSECFELGKSLIQPFKKPLRLGVAADFIGEVAEFFDVGDFLPDALDIVRRENFIVFGCSFFLFIIETLFGVALVSLVIGKQFCGFRFAGMSAQFGLQLVP